MDINIKENKLEEKTTMINITYIAIFVIIAVIIAILIKLDRTLKAEIKRRNDQDLILYNYIKDNCQILEKKIKVISNEKNKL